MTNTELREVNLSPRRFGKSHASWQLFLKACKDGETAVYRSQWGDVYSPAYHATLIDEAVREARVEERKAITNKVKCVGFSEDPEFLCDKILPIDEMQATAKGPNTWYCKECYQRGLDMEYEAMGLR
jgi:hypothetical protein